METAFSKVYYYFNLYIISYDNIQQIILLSMPTVCVHFQYSLIKYLLCIIL